MRRWQAEGQERAKLRDEWILEQLHKGFTQRAVAAELGISEQRVSTLVTRARRRLDPSYSPAAARRKRRAAKARKTREWRASRTPAVPSTNETPS